MVPRYNGLLGERPGPLKPIVRYKIIGNLAQFWAKKPKWPIFLFFFMIFFVISDVTDKIVSVITEIHYKGVRYNRNPL